LPYPADPPNDRLQGPRGDTLISTRCHVAAFENIGGTRATKWSTARYEWVSVFTPDADAMDKYANESVTEDEAVLFELRSPGMVRPVWHARIDTIWGLVVGYV